MFEGLKVEARTQAGESCLHARLVYRTAPGERLLPVPLSAVPPLRRSAVHSSPTTDSTTVEPDLGHSPNRRRLADR
jgi:hypothetical protein